MIKINEGGFTLLELLVVIGIIGILAVIAIPNFMTFQAKAKQSEAKLNLSGIYIAEKAFFAEYGSYHSGLGVIGIDFHGAKRYYSMGFASGVVPGLPPGASSRNTFCTDGFGVVVDQGLVGFCGSTIPGSNPGIPSGAVTATFFNFVATADGKITDSSAPANDRWTINNHRVLKNITVGY